MNFAQRAILGCSAALLLAASVPASAATVSWTDWTSRPSNTTVAGNLLVGATNVAVTYTGAINFVQTAGGTNYWNPSAPYISIGVVDNAPPAADIISLSTGGTKTITFSQAVQDPLIALVSWNGNTVDFGVAIEILSFGRGFWGNGTPILNAGGTGFFGQGEVHGVIRLPGVHSSITFTDTNENWHGFTVGVVGLPPPPPVPEPAILALLGFGLVGFGLARRRRTS